MMYDNYESNDDNSSQDFVMSSNIVQSHQPSASQSLSKRSNGKQQMQSYHQTSGTSLLSPAPLNLKTSSNNNNSTSEGSNLNFSPATATRRPSPSSPVQQQQQHSNPPKSKKNSSLSSCLSSLSLPSSASTASALINATTGTNPVKINTTTPGNFTCCFPVSLLCPVTLISLNH